MTRRFARLAWAAAVSTYLLIVFGAIVRITGSGLGCGEHWPLCNGRVLPPLDPPTMIEYAHRLIAAAVSVLVAALAILTWRLRHGGQPDRPSRAAYLALGLLILQVALGAITVKLALPPWTVILHLGTAMLLLAVLLVAARPGEPRALRAAPAGAALLGFVTVLFGALTANLGAASACLGFPLCNGHFASPGTPLAEVHWTHRLLAYGLAAYVLGWAWRSGARAPRYVLGLVGLQVGVAAAMVLRALPAALQATHVALGAGVWAGLVLAL